MSSPVVESQKRLEEVDVKGKYGKGASGNRANEPPFTPSPGKMTKSQLG